MVAMGVTICSLPVESAHMKWMMTFFRYSRFSVSRDLGAWVFVCVCGAELAIEPWLIKHNVDRPVSS